MVESYRFEMDFEYFCMHQLISPSQKEKFKAWLGDKARKRYSKPEWTLLWEEFNKSSLEYA